LAGAEFEAAADGLEERRAAHIVVPPGEATEEVHAVVARSGQF
jgi:hypothetical protein